MNTYQQHFTSRYSRISALLELDIMVAQQAQREVSPVSPPLAL